MDDVEAVVHLAGQPTEAPWPVLREANIEGSFQLFEAARRAGVQRVVYASSNHAVGFTPDHPRPAGGHRRRGRTPCTASARSSERPSARYYVERYGMRVACVRIGTFAPRPPTCGPCPRGCPPATAPGWWTPACARLTSGSRSCGASRRTPAGPGRSTRPCAGLPAQSTTPSTTPSTSPRQNRRASDGFVGGGFTSPGFGIDEVAAPRMTHVSDAARARVDRRRGRPARPPGNCAPSSPPAMTPSWPTGSAAR